MSSANAATPIGVLAGGRPQSASACMFSRAAKDCAALLRLEAGPNLFARELSGDAEVTHEGEAVQEAVQVGERGGEDA